METPSLYILFSHLPYWNYISIYVWKSELTEEYIIFIFSQAGGDLFMLAIQVWIPSLIYK